MNCVWNAYLYNIDLHMTAFLQHSNLVSHLQSQLGNWCTFTTYLPKIDILCNKKRLLRFSIFTVCYLFTMQYLQLQGDFHERVRQRLIKFNGRRLESCCAWGCCYCRIFFFQFHTFFQIIMFTIPQKVILSTTFATFIF